MLKRRSCDARGERRAQKRAGGDEWLRYLDEKESALKEFAKHPESRTTRHHMNALTARATMRPKSARATVDCTAVAYFARSVSGIRVLGRSSQARASGSGDQPVPQPTTSCVLGVDARLAHPIHPVRSS